MPEQRLARTRDHYQGWISQAILAKDNMRYVGDGHVMAIINGKCRVRILGDRDTRWFSLEEIQREMK